MEQLCVSDGISFQDRTLISFCPTSVPTTFFPLGNLLPPAYEQQEDGSVRFCLYYPKANAVSLLLMGTECIQLELCRDGDFWTGVARGLDGFVAIAISVDGNRVLNERLPIGFFDSRPTNFLELLSGDKVILPRTENHGTVAAAFLDSRATGRMERILVYLPYGYMNGTDRYPVLYLQHGIGENETVWVTEGKMNFICDNLMDSGEAEPCIVVMCNGMVTEEKEDGIRLYPFDRFEQLLVEEVIPYVDSHFRTMADPAYRAMAGLSMGSMQTSYISLLHPELFCYVGLFSGFVRNFLTGENEHLEKLDGYRDRLKLYFRGMGDRDPFLPNFFEDDALLAGHDVSCIRKIYSGAHEWKVWQQCFHDFIKILFKKEKNDDGLPDL